MIHFQDVWFDYSPEITPEEQWNLRKISLSIQPGEYLALIGKNGSGKSTLARLCNGLLLPDRGQVVIDGHSTANPDHIWEVRRKVGLIFQNPDNQIVGATVADDIAFGLENIGCPTAEIRERVDYAMSQMGLTAFADRSPDQLSGGQKQRLAIASFLALQPQVMIFDEATTMIDPQGRAEILQIIDKLHQDGKTILHITHSLAEAMKAERILLLDQGECCLDFRSADILQVWEPLQQYAVDFPPMLLVAKHLHDWGYPIDIKHRQPTEMVEELWKLHLKK
ncbi:energy-coupling factor transport system ATP-binding protein [Seinonella peptonophila]|uniref:Energy-coupling factor transport system ATP-binding protein n=1 Tax=Seinonella peptonophila TaxID=112248 RepID=A0A1M4YXH6_9BACL|nr:energy-coupling factor transporter ATPase [Seinonella peptonophila]SHF10440.1 energy-coupling factor transport system ATP-binding protein [Seinonella peptonophila]